MELELAISQYVDGTLSSAEASALEAILASDPNARAMLEQEQRLSKFLSVAAGASPLPQIDWQRLSDRLASAVDDADAAPARSFKLFAPRSFLALAASALLAVGVGIVVHFNAASTSPVTKVAVVPTAARAVLEVSGPKVEVASSDAVVQVSIGPGKVMADTTGLSRYSDDLVSRESRLVIASGIGKASDLPVLPY